jgi:hypothetical protein
MTEQETIEAGKGTLDPFVGHPVCGKVGCGKPAVAEILLPRFGAFYEAFACADHQSAGAKIAELVMPNDKAQF